MKQYFVVYTWKDGDIVKFGNAIIEVDTSEGPVLVATKSGMIELHTRIERLVNESPIVVVNIIKLTI